MVVSCTAVKCCHPYFYHRFVPGLLAHLLLPPLAHCLVSLGACDSVAARVEQSRLIAGDDGLQVGLAHRLALGNRRFDDMVITPVAPFVVQILTHLFRVATTKISARIRHGVCLWAIEPDNATFALTVRADPAD